MQRVLFFPATVGIMVSRIRHYVEVFPPQGFRTLRFIRHDPYASWERTKEVNFTLYGVLADAVTVPLFKFHGVEESEGCSVLIGCDEPGDAPWLEQLLARLEYVRSLLAEEGWPDWLC